MWGLCLSLLSWIGLNPVAWVAGLIGTTEPALKLFVSILMSYPMAIVYHKHVRQHKELRNWYFIITGIDMAWYNFGIAMYHNAIPAIVIHLSTKVLGPGKMNALMTLVFNMTYLLIGYIVTESEDYDITWTMPHCVLTLKLIALSFDMWDGQLMKAGKELSGNAKKSAIPEPPTLAELVGFVYFPSCFLVGPIFSFKRYSDFIGDQFPLDAEVDVYTGQAMARLVQGMLYVMAHMVGVAVFDIKYMLSDDFTTNSVWYRHFYCGMWAHFALYKYISCWLLTEASCIRFGLSYNGRDAAGSRWDACNNIRLLRFEGATKFQHYIDSFNCNTNHFAMEYIYKRLKFLGNRHLSQLFTLVFLALWHGVRSGYYMTFFNEFIIIYMEKELEAILVKTVIYHKIWEHNVGKYLLYGILKAYTIVFMGWSLAPFDLKVFSKWYVVYSSLYFSGFLFFLLWPFVYKPLLLKSLKALNVKRVEVKKEQ